MKDFSIINGFVKSICAKVKKDDVITAYFKNGDSAEYTKNILHLLKTDKDVAEITDSDGVVIFINNG